MLPWVNYDHDSCDFHYFQETGVNMELSRKRIYVSSFSSPVGMMTVAGDGDHVTGLWFCGQKHYMSGTETCDIVLRDDTELFGRVKDWLGEYFDGKNPDAAAIPVSLGGSQFSLEVWEALREIKYGSTATYKDVAEAVARKAGKSRISPRAVGAAIGRNPVSILIPCHRVIGSDGSLTGYAAGTEIKLKLLRLEGAETGIRPGLKKRTHG